MSYDESEILIIIKLIGKNYNGKSLTETELEILSEALKREINSSINFTDIEKQTINNLIDIEKERSKRR